MNRSALCSNAFLSAGVVAAIAVVVAAPAPTARATNGLKNAFAARYPGSTLLSRTATATGNQCYVCHHPNDEANPGNCYKEAIALRLAAGRTNAQAIADVELMDSDGDGVNNRDEILLARTDMTGQVGYNPGLIGNKGTDPCFTNTNAAVTNQIETPPNTCPADFNGDGFVNALDYDAFAELFEAGDPGADMNADGFVNALDYDAFAEHFEAGC
ncbi:MAG: hypothetical protein IT432_08255 [Phycisphaerales bacterium]|nr:hypothetical protein [Phycisphaerales bacterium]